MEAEYNSFVETIETAFEQGDFPDEAKLILLGKIAYAVEVGELTLAEAEQLDAMMGGVRKQYAKAFEIATFGDAREFADE